MLTEVTPVIGLPDAFGRPTHGVVATELELRHVLFAIECQHGGATQILDSPEQRFATPVAIFRHRSDIARDHGSISNVPNRLGHVCNGIRFFKSIVTPTTSRVTVWKRTPR